MRMLTWAFLVAGAAGALAPWAVGLDGDPYTAAGRAAGLLAGYLIAVQVVLMSRVPVVERLVGGVRRSLWHRRIGASVFALMIAHIVFITIGYAAGSSILETSWGLITGTAGILAAWAGTLLLIAIGLSSIRAIKRRMRYESWYYLHLYTYLAAFLAFLHQIWLGADLAGPARWWWIGLYGTAAALAVHGRVLRPLRHALVHRFRVAKVVEEAPGVTSIHIRGCRMARLRAKPGQFFRFRFLSGHGWWQAHPFSLSAAPGRWGIRITVKDSGDHSAQLQTVAPGTKVLVEGPYGDFTADRRVNDKVVMIAAGIGITPIRALLEEIPDALVIYRARSESELVFKRELDHLSPRVVYVVGDSGDEAARQALSPAGLDRLVPDLGERDVYLCGPPGLVQHLLGALRRLRVPERHVHLDPFEM